MKVDITLFPVLGTQMSQRRTGPRPSRSNTGNMRRKSTQDSNTSEVKKDGWIWSIGERGKMTEKEVLEWMDEGK
jgi:hypothetical protein